MKNHLSVWVLAIAAFAANNGHSRAVERAGTTAINEETPIACKIFDAQPAIDSDDAAIRERARKAKDEGDFDAELKFDQQALNLGDCSPLSSIGDIYMGDAAHIKWINYPEAIRWRKIWGASVARERDDAYEQVGEIFELYLQKYSEALMWYKLSDSVQHFGFGYPSRAQTRIGLLYDQGLGAQRDHKIAREWMTKAAVSGDSVAISWIKKDDDRIANENAKEADQMEREFVAEQKVSLAMWKARPLAKRINECREACRNLESSCRSDNEFKGMVMLSTPSPFVLGLAAGGIKNCSNVGASCVEQCIPTGEVR